MSAPLLQVRDLTVTYAGGIRAVRGVSFTLDAGQVLGVAGRSGSGKTTVGLSLLRLLPASAAVTGEVLLHGESLLSASWGRLRAVRWAGVSVVFQGAMNALNPVQTIGDQICEPILLHQKISRRAARARAAELLTSVGMNARGQRSYPHELSGGQRQRVMIAMALACEPDLIIADEPTTALDVIAQAQVLDLLAGLVTASGIGMIMVSHDLSVLSARCDRLAVMDAGKLAEIGPPDELMGSPRHPYTAILARSFPRAGDAASRYNPAALPGDPPARHAASGGAPVLEARALRVVHPARVGRGSARAVDGVNLAVAPGEILALIGESGCGKSTLARALVGLVRPAAGEIRRNGMPLRYGGGELRAHRRAVQLIGQDPGGALNPRQTVYDAVAEGPRLHGLRAGLNERVRSALARAGLRPPGQFAGRYPHQLSGGQQQRVVIAGALALDPSVLIADEPVSSLDAPVRGEILRLLLELCGQLSLSAVIISHDLGTAWNVADRVAVMYLGRIVETGPVADVLLRPRHPYTQALVSLLGEGGSSGPLLSGEPPDPTAIPGGCRFHPRCPRLAALDAADEGTACRLVDPPVLPETGGNLVACHRVDLEARP